jgi:hypothetical protein
MEGITGYPFRFAFRERFGGIEKLPVSGIF